MFGIKFLHQINVGVISIAEGLLVLIPMAIALSLSLRTARYFDKRRFDLLVTGSLVVTAVTLAYRGVSAL